MRSRTLRLLILNGDQMKSAALRLLASIHVFFAVSVNGVEVFAEVVVDGNVLPECFYLDAEPESQVSAVQEVSKELYFKAIEGIDLVANEYFAQVVNSSQTNIRTYSCGSTIFLRPNFPSPGCCDSVIVIFGSRDYYVYFRKRTGLYHWSSNIVHLEENEGIEDWTGVPLMPPALLCRSGKCIEAP